MVPIIDLHCDLLCYLQKDNKRSPFDKQSRCSLAQMKEGNVKLQVLALYAATEKKSSLEGKEQKDIFSKLNKSFFSPFEEMVLEKDLFSSSSFVMSALENLSLVIEEDEPLDLFFKRMELWKEDLGKIFYISLTWNFPNRFGGGCLSHEGLKEDGKRVLEWLDGKKIALDLSHGSDELIEDIFSYVDAKNLKLPLMASHSNFRLVENHPRNLSDEMAKELIRRKGLIGMNVYPPILGKDPSFLFRHLDHGLSLGGEDVLCFGADFFCETDDILKGLKIPYFDKLSNASFYPKMLQEGEKKFSKNFLQKLSYQNAFFFLKKNS